MYRGKVMRDKERSKSNQTLMAAAFQDHLIRSMALTDSLGPRKIPLGKATQRQMKKDIKPLIDTGLGCRKPRRKSIEKEYILDSKPPQATLAQKLGLVEAPAELLSEGDWKIAKSKSNNRSDSQLPCVICKEDFGLQQQVLLSCTHVFHRACLEAFERFTGKKTCPMCRKEQYQTRVIHEGAKSHRIKSATIIQATWRGYVVRCWYNKLRETIPPKDPSLRKKFFENKLQTITDRMVKSYENNINVFLSEIDQSLEASRKVFRNFDVLFKQFSEEDWEQIQLKAVVRGEAECPICLTSLYGDSLSSDSKTLTNSSTNKHSKVNSKFGDTTVHKVSKTDDPCVSGMDKPTLDDRLANRMRQTVLLSCSHVFHLTCLTTFEEIVTCETGKSCPVCRSNYQKRVL